MTSPKADMDALVERVWIDLRQLGKGEDFGEYERWLLRAFIARLKPADRKFLAERDGTMRVVPVAPTEEMVAAGWIDKEDVSPADIYCAMLAAAPQEESSDG